MGDNRGSRAGGGRGEAKEAGRHARSGGRRSLGDGWTIDWAMVSVLIKAVLNCSSGTGAVVSSSLLAGV